MPPRPAYLPQELVEEVLVWLPVEALIKFRCVSKPWLALIDSTQFRQLHARRIQSWTSTVGHHKFLFRWNRCHINTWTEKFVVANYDSRDKLLKTTMLDLPFPCNKDETFGCILLGSCNGMLFLRAFEGSSSDLFLWNPYINKYWKVPYYPFPVSAANNCMAVAHHSFGYDDIADDYKLVRWVEFYFLPSGVTNSNQQHVIVYSLKSNSWKTLPKFPYSRPFNIHYNTEGGTLVNGALHWMLMDDLDSSRDLVIVALDLRTESCQVIQLPSELRQEPAEPFLLDLDGCLCLLPNHKLEKPSLNVWTMKDYGVEDSWTKLTVKLSNLFEFTRAPCMVPPLYPVGWSQRKTKLFFSYEDRVMWYDTEKEDWVWASLVIPTSMEYSSIWNVLHFTGNLIEPTPGINGKSTGGIKRLEGNLFC